MHRRLGLYADPINISGMLAAERGKSAANARDLVAAFDDIAARRNVMHERTVEHCPPIQVGETSLPTPGCAISPSFPSIAADPDERYLAEEVMFAFRPTGAWSLPEGTSSAAVHILRHHRRGLGSQPAGN